MNASQKDYRALSSSLPLGDSLFSISYSVRFVKNFFLLFSKAFRRFSTRFELFRPPPLAKQLIYITRCHLQCQAFFSFFALFFGKASGAALPFGKQRFFPLFVPKFRQKIPPANTGGMQRLMPCPDQACFISSASIMTLSTLPSTLILPSATATCGTSLPLRTFSKLVIVPETHASRSIYS